MKQYIKQSLLNHPVNSKSDSQTIQLWKNRYLKFLESLENQSIPDDTMYQVHHIVPRSWNLDLAKDDNNLIKLTIKQHIIAHHILSKTGDYQMKCAIRQMVNAKTDEELHKAVFVVNLRNIYNKWWKHHLSKPVINLHTLQVYSSAREASVRIGVTKQGIANSIRKQERSKGYFYAYLTDNLDIDKKLKELEEIESNKEKNRRVKISNGHTRRIINLNTKEIFDSVEDACKKYGITVSAINFAIRKCTTSKGCFWSLYNEKEDYNAKLQHCLKQIEGLRDIARRFNSHGVHCKEVTTGFEFETYKSAANYFGYSAYQVRRSVVDNKSLCRGHKFIKCLNNTL